MMVGSTLGTVIVGDETMLFVDFTLGTGVVLVRVVGGWAGFGLQRCWNNFLKSSFQFG